MTKLQHQLFVKKVMELVKFYLILFLVKSRSIKNLVVWSLKLLQELTLKKLNL